MLLCHDPNFPKVWSLQETQGGSGRKLGWGLASGVGWLFLGLIGAIVAGVYLVGVRPRLSSLR